MTPSKPVMTLEQIRQFSRRSPERGSAAADRGWWDRFAAKVILGLLYDHADACGKRWITRIVRHLHQ